MSVTACSMSKAPAAGRNSSWERLFASGAAELGPDVSALIRADRDLEAASIDLIASASYCPLGLREIEGSHLVNRSPMGLPRRRTVAICENLDAIEELAISRAQRLFGAEYANVQALSSTIANVAVLRAVMPPTGGRLMAFDELSGGHVSHGAGRHITGDHRETTGFGVMPDGLLDLEEARDVARRTQPHVIVAGPSTYPREVDFAALRSIADEVGALLVTDIAHVAGLIVAGIHANPVPFSDLATTSTQKTLCGPRSGAFVFCKSTFREAVDAAIYPGLQGPAMSNLIAARAVQLELVSRPPFAELMHKVVENAHALCDGLMEGGAELYTGGTDSHMVVPYAGQDWMQGQLVTGFGRYAVTGNSIRVPGAGREPRIAFRLGTTAMTIRNMGTAEFVEVGEMLARILGAGPGAPVELAIKERLAAIAAEFPVPSYVD